MKPELVLLAAAIAGLLANPDFYQIMQPVAEQTNQDIQTATAKIAMRYVKALIVEYEKEESCA